MLVLKINPIVVFVGTYLYLGTSRLLDGFLHFKALSGWPVGNSFYKKESSALFRLLLILLGGILSPSQLIILILTLAKNEKFPLKLSSIRVTRKNSARE